VIAPGGPKPTKKPVDAGGVGEGQQSPISGGGGGLLSDPDCMRSDARLVEMAARRRWPVRKATRRLVVERLESVVERNQDDAVAISAARALAAIDGLNIKREQGPPSSTVNVGVSVSVGQSVEAALHEPEFLAYLEGRSDSHTVRPAGHSGQVPDSTPRPSN
jgi:hypothetical protein